MSRRAATNRWIIAATSFAGFGGAPSIVHAHLVNTGLGPIYDGVGHVFVSAEDLIPVIALSLLAGLRGTAAGRLTLFCLPIAWLLGGLAGYQGVLEEFSGAQLIPVASFVCLGALIAADLQLPAWLMFVLTALVGALHGVINGIAVREAAEDPLGLLGISAAVFVLVALLSALVVSLKRPWTRIAVRVAGSWTAAIGLLLLGWQLRQS